MNIDSDPLLSANAPASMFTKEAHRGGRPILLIYASCHGRTLAEYFKRRQDVLDRYDIWRLETGNMKTAIDTGVDSNVSNRPSIRQIFALSDVLVTYNMGARHGQLSLDNVARHIRPNAKIITFVAPNFSVFCPFGYGYTATIGVMALLDKGWSKNWIWDGFINGDFDPLFAIRWRLELGRLHDKEAYHDIGLADFVIRNHKKVKLWTAPSHPTFIPMAYVGNEVCGRLGLQHSSEDHILSLDYMCAAVAGQPETDYEFRYFGFQYPKRHTDVAGGMDYYRGVLDNAVEHWKSGGVITPQMD